MKKAILLSVIFIFSCISLASAEISIKAEVDKTKLTTDEVLTYKIIIDSSEKNLPAPQAPKFEGFTVLFSGQSSTISFSGNNVKTSLMYTFALAPLNAGKFKIEPSMLKIKKQTYATAGFEIEVIPGKGKPRTPVPQKPSLPKKSLPESEEPQTTL